MSWLWNWWNQKTTSGFSPELEVRGGDVIAELQAYFDRTGLCEYAEAGGYDDETFIAELRALVQRAREPLVVATERRRQFGEMLERVVFAPRFLELHPEYRDKLAGVIRRIAIEENYFYDWHYWRLTGSRLLDDCIEFEIIAKLKMD